jgi:anti-sigma B factor antagonist
MLTCPTSAFSSGVENGQPTMVDAHTGVNVRTEPYSTWLESQRAAMSGSGPPGRASSIGSTGDCGPTIGSAAECHTSAGDNGLERRTAGIAPTISLGHTSPVSESAEGFGIEWVLEEGVATMTVRGELDLATRTVLLSEVASAVGQGAAAVAIDISGLSFVDSSGIGAFLQVRKLGVPVSLRNPRGRVRKLLELVLIDSVIPVEYGPDEAGQAPQRA